MAFVWRACCALLAAAVLSPPAPAADLVDLGVDLGNSEPVVGFDLPRAVAVREVDGAEGVALLAPGERLLSVELPVSMLVRRGDIRRVDEVVVEVDGSAAGLAVHDYSPATRLESEFTGDIEVQSTTENERHREVSLGGTVAKLAPGGGVSRTRQEVETERLARRAPKQAVVVSGPINQRRGVLFKFRPSSQTTLEGEHPLRLTFVAPADWSGGSLEVRCRAAGERKILFVKQPAVWGSVGGQVELRQSKPLGTPGHRTADPFIDPFIDPPREPLGEPVRQTAAKPVLPFEVAAEPARPAPTATGPIWKPRKVVGAVSDGDRL